MLTSQRSIFYPFIWICHCERKRNSPAYYQSAGFFALRLRMTGRWQLAPTAAQSASVTSDSHLYITPDLSRSLKTVRLERPSLRHSGLRSGIYSFLSLRRNSGVNNNCWRGKLQRRVLSDRSEFTSLDAEPCRLLVNGCVAAGFVKLLPPKVSPSGGLNRKFYKNIVNYLI